MLRELAIKQDQSLAEVNNLADLGQIANEIASADAFNDYRSRKAKNTIRRQDADLAKFAEYLTDKGVEVGDFANDAAAWEGITWGLVAGFMRWQLTQGYAVSSANVRLSTVKTYSKLAFKAGAIGAEDYALIKAVEGYNRRESNLVDEYREAAGIETRIGDKKAESISLTVNQAADLKDQPDTPQGRRDALLMCLLLDHGLRVSEVAELQIENFDLDNGEMRFYRPKVDDIQTHKLSGDTWRAARAYITTDLTRKHGPLLMGSVKGGKLTGVMSIRGINKRVRLLGKAAGIAGLSPHDCRHYAATRLAKEKSMRELMDIFGWTSPAMAIRYVEAAKVVKVE